MSQPAATGSQPRSVSPELLDSPSSGDLHPSSPDFDFQPDQSHLPDSETYSPPAVYIDENARERDTNLDTSSVTTIAVWSPQNDNQAQRARSPAVELPEPASELGIDENTRHSESSLASFASSLGVDERAHSSTVDLTEPAPQLRENDGVSNAIQSETIDGRNEDSNSAFASDCEEPPAKMRKVTSPEKPAEETDGETCPICLDSWGNSGEHRLVALKCGHLFGAQCVQRWLRAQPPRDRACPTCKTKATVKDLRFIYARRLVAADTSQITALQKQVETLQAEKSRVELELEKSKISHRACSMQLEVLRGLMKSQAAGREPPARRSWRFALEKNLELAKDGGCRVLAYDHRSYELYASQKSASALFPGHGVRRVSLVDYKPGAFVLLHPKPVRDLTYSQPRGLLLSAALDGAARVVERGVAGATVRAGVPLWSCSWDYLRGHEFYVGGVGGAVRHYDVRYPDRCLRALAAPGDASPVVSLRSTEHGLLGCQLNSCWLWQPGAAAPRALPVAGPFMSLNYDEESGRAVVWSRPAAGARSRLALLRLPGAEPEEVFPGSARAAVLARAGWVRAPGAAWVAAHSESEAALRLHGLDGARALALPCAEPALDLASVQLQGAALLAALSDARLRIYKAVPIGT